MSPGSLRSRLAVWHVAMLLITLGAFAGLLYFVLSRNLQHHHDDELADQAALVNSYLQRRPISETTVLDALRDARVSSRFVMIRDLDGDLKFREPALQTTEPNIGRHAVLTHAAMARPTGPEFFTVELEQSGAVRFICIPLQQAGLFLQIGDPIGDVGTTMDAVRRASLTLIPIVLIVSSLGSWLLARRALQPVRQMTATLREIEARDLSQRVQIDANDSELTGLVASINQLLDRLQRSFASLRQFAGDVSHQLQTPLTVIKSTIESQLRRPDAATHHAALTELAHQIDGISATVTGLQALALADAPIPAGSFSLSASVTEGTDIIGTLAEMKGVNLIREIAPDIQSTGDPVRLRQIVLNLGENAVKFTPPGGMIQIHLNRDGNEAVLTVGDTGPGISRDDQSRVFQRLFRGDGSAGREGIGIGLAIVKGIVDAHGGKIDVDSRPACGATFTVRLPVVTPY